MMTKDTRMGISDCNDSTQERSTSFFSVQHFRQIGPLYYFERFGTPDPFLLDYFIGVTEL